VQIAPKVLSMADNARGKSKHQRENGPVARRLAENLKSLPAKTTARRMKKGRGKKKVDRRLAEAGKFRVERHILCAAEV